MSQYQYQYEAPYMGEQGRSEDPLSPMVEDAGEVMDSGGKDKDGDADMERPPSKRARKAAGETPAQGPSEEKKALDSATFNPKVVEIQGSRS